MDYCNVVVNYFNVVMNCFNVVMNFRHLKLYLLSEYEIFREDSLPVGRLFDEISLL